MAMYYYEAISFSGQKIKGDMEAASRAAVVDHLQRKGYLPLLAKDKKASDWSRLSALDFFDNKQLSMREIAYFTQELATMLQAGLSLERALAMLASIADKPKLTAFLNAVLARVRMGSSFAEALASVETVKLPKAYIGMVRAGEAGGGGMLEATLERLADYLNKTQAMRESVSSALLYPIILVAMAAISIIIMLLFVLPQFEPLFKSAGAAIPFSTRVVMAVGHGLRDYGFIGLILVIFAGFGLRQALQRDNIKLWKDQKLLALPKIGTVITKAQTARFCRTLGALQSNGVPLASALTIAIESFENQVFINTVQKIVQQVREGELLSTGLIKSNLFLPLTTQMIRVGEETGQLDVVLLKLADIYDRDVQRFIERFMVLLAPLLTIVLGAIIATIIASVLSAILSVNDLVT